ncbi:ankyrin repeat-containing domain protein [Hypoxylon sp. FL1857]|nr:ankyrin repeat-containing domain protein [Hypoxylon sp. FL1857]
MTKGDVRGIRRDGLTIIHDPPSAELDLFILHGLGGSPSTTFRSESSGFFWPKDLPRWLPRARIGLFGYIADVANGSENMMGVQQHAESLLFHLRNNRTGRQSKRPIVFIGHSFGGHVIKQALILSSNRKGDCGIVSSTQLVVFLGVPHHGSHLLQKNRAPLVVAMGRAINHSVPPKIMTALQPEADETYIVNTQFMRIKGDISIINFYEQKPQGLVGDVVVTRGSAIFDCETSENMPVARNHRDLARFEAADDDFYHTLCQTLLRKVAEFTSLRKEAELYETSKRGRESLLNILGDPSLPPTLDQTKTPHSNTLGWLWDEQSELSKWITKGSGLFAVTGKPGSGKSVLMNAVNAGIRIHFGNTFSTLVSHFFNGRGNPIEKSIEGFLRSILFQLIRDDVRFFHGLEQDWTSLWGGKFSDEERESSFVRDFQTHRLTIPILKELLLNAIKGAPENHKVFILVDGLDECEVEPTGLSSMVSLLNDIANSHKPGLVRICFSCRHLPSYSSAQLFGWFNLQERNRSDIGNFIDDHWNSMPSMWIYDNEMAKLKTSLVSRADGVFLWVRIILEGVQKALTAGATVSELKTIINTPNQLYGLFSMLIGRIEPEFMEESRTMFSIILTAKRPLSLREFRYILALKGCKFESQQQMNRSHDVIQSDEIMKRRIMSRCGGLVEIKNSGADEPENNSIQFIHQSVKDFLGQSHDTETPISDPETLIQCGHSALSRACANYLCQTDIWSLARRPDWRYHPRKASSFRSRFVFLDYAEENWFSHLREVEASKTTDRDTANALLNEPDHFETWRLIHNRLHSSDALNQDYNATQLAVEQNLPHTLKLLCKNGLVDVDTWSWKFGSYMHLAATKNNVDVMRVLLDNGAKVNMKGTKNQTPLVEACLLGHVESATLLLESGAEVIDFASSTNDPLDAAVQSGNADLVKLVLNNAATTYAHPLSRKRAISSLVKWNWEIYYKDPIEGRGNMQVELTKRATIFQMISSGSNFENQSEEKIGLILAWAFSGSLVRTVQPLMDFNLDGLEGSKSWLRPALDMICWFGSVDPVSMLLQGLRVGDELPKWAQAPSGQYYRTLVHWAALNPRDSVLSYLLELGLSPDSQDINGETPLHLAARERKDAHVDILLRYGADRTVNSARGFRAFHKAIQVMTSHAPARILSRLIVDSSDINLQVADGVSPIQLACKAGATTAIRWLLDKGADFNVQDDLKRTVLHSAASSYSPESVEILEFLIKQGHDIMARDAGNMTPLHHVLYSYDMKDDMYDPDIALANAKCLLQNGADVNAQDQEGNTPLHLAAWKSHKAIVSLFLRAGVQASKTDSRGLTAIELAKDEEIREMIEMASS